MPVKLNVLRSKVLSLTVDRTVRNYTITLRLMFATMLTLRAIILLGEPN